MCIVGQSGAAAPARGESSPRAPARSGEASAPCPGLGKLALDAASLTCTPAPSSRTPRSDESLPSLDLTGTAAASGDEDGFVETPRAEVGVPSAEWCWQPWALPEAGAPPLAERCWDLRGVALQLQPDGRAGEWQHDQQQVDVAQSFAEPWPAQPAYPQTPQEQQLLYVALGGLDQLAAPFASVAQQFMFAALPEALAGAAAAPAQLQEGHRARLAPLPLTSTAEGPKGKGKGKGVAGRGKGKGCSASAQWPPRQQDRRAARSGRRPSLPPVFDAAWCDARLADLEAAETRGDALAAVSGQALQLSFDKAGTRLVQKALEVADRETQDALLMELSGHMLEMVESPHANYVPQQIFNVVPAARLGAVIQEFECRAEHVARHRFGCRILNQLLAHCSKRPESAVIVDALLSKAGELCHHTYAHHVIEGILEHTDDAQHKHRVYRALLEDLLRTAQHYHGGYVLKAAITHCSLGDVTSLCESLTDRVVEVTATRIGCHLYKELCEHPRVREQAVAALATHAALLRQRPESRRLVGRVLGEAAA